jgi:hypothetical protein
MVSFFLLLVILLPSFAKIKLFLTDVKRFLEEMQEEEEGLVLLPAFNSNAKSLSNIPEVGLCLPGPLK